MAAHEFSRAPQLPRSWQNARVFREGPKVRIRLPPAESPVRTDFSRGRSRTPSRS